MRAPILLAAVITGVARLCHATTIHVPADQPTIQAGINAAVSGDTVEIACGTYYEHHLVIKAGVAVRSESGLPECTTIDAQGLGRVFLASNLGTSVSITGLTITHGFTDGPYPANHGGGVYLEGSSPTFSRCRFVDNSTGGGSLRVGGGGGIGGQNSGPVILDCEFRDNQVPGNGGAIYLRNQPAARVSGCLFVSNRSQRGGAIESDDASIVVEDCVFTANIASTGGAMMLSGTAPHVSRCTFTSNTDGAIYGLNGAEALIEECVFEGNDSPDHPGAISWQRGAPRFHSCLFRGNHSTGVGGALYARDGAHVTMSDCQFIDNDSDLGGALYFEDEATLQLLGCLALRNRARYGSVLYTSLSASSVVQGCTIVGNAGGAGVLSVRGHTTVQNSIVAGNTSQPVVFCWQDDAIDIACSDFWANSGGNWPGCIAGQDQINDNFSADPVFCDSGQDDFKLRSDSPCLPGNHPAGAACDLVGAFPLGCGTVPVEPRSWGQIKTAYR